MRDTRAVRREALKAAFPRTIPILTGFLFLGTSYGIYMRLSGFAWYFPTLMALTIFAGSMEFVAVNLLLAPFDPLGALLLTLMVNARHLFYGLAMLEKYRGAGLRKLYLIFGLCDESFSINLTAQPPEGVDRVWFMFFVTLLNQSYWVAGATLGGVFGSLLAFNAKGLEFVMTALLLVIFLENWIKEKSHLSSLIGLGVTAACLAVFGASGFIIPAMLGIIAVLTLLRGPLERAVDAP